MDTTKQIGDWIAALRKNLDELEKLIQPKKVNVEYGWYLLSDADKLEVGDEWQAVDGDWCPTKEAGYTIAETGNICPYRRKIPIPDGYTLIKTR